MPETGFTSLILAWYDRNQRDLPWRQNTKAYSVWLSEIILQQTRVAQGLPYYNRFIEQYPTIKDLAEAPEEEVLRLWQGLGYYSRARNLHKCAKVVVNEHYGHFPQTMEELKTLPGIGNYTAAAIASVSFGEKVPVVDGNVYRLLARYFGVDLDIASSSAFREFFELGASVIDNARPGDFNQAMMEFGALQCTPKQPGCVDCPLQPECVAYAEGRQTELPVKSKKVKVRQRYFHYFLVRSGNKILFRRRQEKDIWQGLFEFPMIETEMKQSLEKLSHPVLDQLDKTRAIFQVEDKIHRHVLSHQVLNVNFVVINLDNGSEEGLKTFENKWYSFNEAEELPKPVLIANYLDSYLNSIHLQEEKN